MKLFSNESNSGRSAFTLIDVMVGMGVLGIVLVSLFASFSFGFGVLKSSREDLQATQILHEQMETIRLWRWDQVNEKGRIPETFEEGFGNAPAFFKGKISIADVNLSESYSTNMRQITVSLSWTNNSSRRTRSVSTYVSEYGLQNYIFNIE